MTNQPHSQASATVSRAGLGVLGWLTIIFVVLKLNPGGYLDSPVTDWPWWLVLLPLWGGIALFFAIAAVVGLVILVIALLDWWSNRRARKRREAQRQQTLNRRTTL